MHCNWPQFNWVKEGNNTAGGQWSITLCFDEIFTSQHVTSGYSNLKSPFLKSLVLNPPDIFTARIRRMGKVMFEVTPFLWFWVLSGGTPGPDQGQGVPLVLSQLLSGEGQDKGVCLPSPPPARTEYLTPPPPRLAGPGHESVCLLCRR